MFKTIAIDPKP